MTPAVQGIPVARPWLGEEEAAAARRAILSGWVTQGPEVLAFEREFAQVVGAPRACAVSSCTAALHVALSALGIGPGDEVITVSHSFIATANAIRYCGAVPVFVDIDLATFNVDPARIDAAFSPRTRAIVCVHQLGMPCDLAAVLAVARQHGMSVPDTVRHAAVQVIAEEYRVVGYNYRMTDIQAAIGREQLKRLPAMIARRRELASRYGELLSGVDGVIVPHEPAWARSNWQSYAVRLAPGLSQAAVMQTMLDAGVSTRRGVMNAHRERAYAQGPCRVSGDLRRSEQAQDTALILPLYHQMTESDQDRVVAALRAAM